MTKEHKKRYRYMCKKCYKSWSSVNKYKICPTCKSENLDIEEELIL